MHTAAATYMTATLKPGRVQSHSAAQTPNTCEKIASVLPAMAVASPLKRAPAKATVVPPYPLVPAPKTTILGEGVGEADDDIEDIGRFLRPRAEESGCTKKSSKRTRWTVLRLEGEEVTEAVYEIVWAALGKEGKRWLGVRNSRTDGLSPVRRRRVFYPVPSRSRRSPTHLAASCLSRNSAWSP